MYPTHEAGIWPLRKGVKEVNPASDEQRLQNLERFYDLLESLKKHAGVNTLKDCYGRMDWPSRGVYFFFEEGERRSDTGTGLRTVRVGTHALKTGSRTSLWDRLSQHRGQKNSGGGNHRGSIFRLLVGEALITRDKLESETWGKGNSAPLEIRENELEIEKMVSQRIGNLSFLCLKIDDEAGPDSLRGLIERNSIALLSNFDKTKMDTPSENWLGSFSNRERVRLSGLWNQNHVNENPDPQFLHMLETLIIKG